MKELLDKIDNKILSILIDNSRTPISQIAKRCLISKQACHYRIKRLEQEGIIHGYKAKIDISRLGYNTYCIYLKIISMPQEEETRTIEQVRQNPNIRWIVTCTGRWDFMIAASSKNNSEFNTLLKNILKTFKKTIIEYETAIIISTQDLWMREKNNIKRPLNETRTAEEYLIDKHDQKILELLQENARIETTAMAKQIPLTAEAISRRIKKLYAEGIIHSYSLSIDKEKLGTTWYQVQFLLQDITAQEEKHLVARIAMIEGVSYIVRMIGKWNFEINMHCKNVGEFRNNLNSIREALSEHIRDYDTNIIFQKHKSQTYIIDTNTRGNK
jgi:Lrp/AsnC family transcriptional regulator for asnA, asnC and gidA